MGLPVARRLACSGYRVKGSTTDPAKLPALKDSGIEGYVVECRPAVTGEDLPAFFQSEILFLTIPFKRDWPDPEDYRRQVASVVDHARNGAVRWIIFTSSTSVYTASGGEVREEDVIVPQGERQRVLWNTEQDLLGAEGMSVTVLRFGGLYGGSRELGRILGRSRAAQRSGDSRVNLIHLDDCVAIVNAVIAAGLTNEILNAVSDGHPTRRELYTRKAQEAGAPMPEFTAGTEGPDKIVSNRKLKTLLSYTFIHPDPLE